MPAVTSFLADPRYSVRNLSAAIIQIPNMYSLLSDMGLFPEVGIPVTYVEIEIKKGSLSLIPMSTRGAPSPRVKRDSRNIRMLPTLFMQMDDHLRPSDLQNLRAFGTEGAFESFDALLAERFMKLQMMYRQSHEFLRWGALTGDVHDADGTTVLYNCYQEMGEAQASFDMKFGSTQTNGPLMATKAIRRYFEKTLLGETMTGMIHFASSEYMDKLTQHPMYQEMYKFQQATPNPMFEDLEVFKIGSHLFVEHNGFASYTREDGSQVNRRFIPEGEAIGVPLGTTECFRSYFAPGEFMSAVNQNGQSMYVSMRELEHDKGIEIHTESAPFFAVQKPRLVVRSYSSN